MVVYLIVGIIAVLLSLLDNNKKRGLYFAFSIITVFLGIRYMWGNDYIAYLDNYQVFNTFDFDLFDIGASGDLYRHNEWGWVVINRLFGFLHLGFFGMIIALTLFENLVVFKFFEKHITPKRYWMAILFWYFNVMSFCVNASMMRQYLCICIYLIVVDLMISKEKKGYLLWSIGIILLSMTIHRSGIVLLGSLPFFYLRLNKGRSSFVFLVVVGIVFIFWNAFGTSIIEPIVMNVLEEDEFSEYMIYVGEQKSGALSSGLGVIFRYIVFASYLIMLPHFEKEKQQPIVSLFLLSYFFEPIAAIAPLASRLALYFSFFTPLCWTWLFEKGKMRPILYVLFAAELAILIREIPLFFYSKLWMSSFFEYHTIFSAEGWM